MEKTRLKTRLEAEFETKDLEPLVYFLGMEVARNDKGISVSKRKFVFSFPKFEKNFNIKL